MGKTRHIEIFETLRREILSGRFGNATKFPSGSELVERFGVSYPTINRVMSRLRDAGLVATRSGALPSLTRFAEHATGVLGVIHPGQHYGVALSRICDELVRQGEHSGWDVVVAEMVETRPEKRLRELVRMIRRFADERIAGLFFQPFEYLRNERAACRRVCSELERCGMPTVLLDYDSLCAGAESRHDVISFDNVSLGLSMGRNLLTKNFCSIAFLLKAGSPPSVVDRMRGVSAAVVESGGAWSWEGNVMACDPSDLKAVGAFVRRHHPDAVVCGNGATAVRLRASLVALGCKDRIRLAAIDSQPEMKGLGIIGFDFLPCDQFAYVAVQTLLARLRDPDLPVCIRTVPGGMITA